MVIEITVTLALTKPITVTGFRTASTLLFAADDEATINSSMLHTVLVHQLAYAKQDY